MSRVNYTVLEIKIKPCTNTTSKTDCSSEEVQAFNINSYLQFSNYVVGDLFIFDTAFQPTEKDPLVYFIEDHVYLTFTQDTGVETLVEIGTYTFWTDVSMIPIK